MKKVLYTRKRPLFTCVYLLSLYLEMFLLLYTGKENLCCRGFYFFFCPISDLTSSAQMGSPVQCGSGSLWFSVCVNQLKSKILNIFYRNGLSGKRLNLFCAKNLERKTRFSASRREVTSIDKQNIRKSPQMNHRIQK